MCLRMSKVSGKAGKIEYALKCLGNVLADKLNQPKEAAEVYIQIAEKIDDNAVDIKANILSPIHKAQFLDQAATFFYRIGTSDSKTKAFEMYQKAFDLYSESLANLTGGKIPENKFRTFKKLAANIACDEKKLNDPEQAAALYQRIARLKEISTAKEGKISYLEWAAQYCERTQKQRKKFEIYQEITEVPQSEELLMDYLMKDFPENQYPYLLLIYEAEYDTDATNLFTLL